MPTWGTGGWQDGDAVEGRVAGALWDICDAVDDGYDQLTAGFDEIWGTFSTQTDDTFAQFWDILRTKFSDQIPPARSIFQNTITYGTPLKLTHPPMTVATSPHRERGHSPDILTGRWSISWLPLISITILLTGQGRV